MSGNRVEARDFLVTRRAKITPQQAGLQLFGDKRRVPGLRREEVAMLVRVSVDYYTRLEKGNLAGASDSVLHAIADALQLDETERTYLFDLARAANATPRAARSRRPQQVGPVVQRILDGMANTPAFVQNGRLDILATNRLGYALYSPIFASPGRPSNIARFVFLDPAAADFYPDWDAAAHLVVAVLRTDAGRDPYDRGLSDLVGELSTRSEDFRTRWGAHNVRVHRTGVKEFHHPVVGDVSLSFEAMDLTAHPGLTLSALSAEPGTASEDALTLLASWAATLEQAQPGISVDHK